jgi:hypothetical protein
VAERLEGCVAGLRMRTGLKSSFATQKMVVILPEVPFNNAFVAPTAAGYSPVEVLPTVNTWDFQTELGIPPDPAFIGCHEITHYVHGLQVGGFWLAVDAIFGDVLTPQIGLDAWFFEGLAPTTSRTSSPAWAACTGPCGAATSTPAWPARASRAATSRSTTATSTSPTTTSMAATSSPS